VFIAALLLLSVGSGIGGPSMLALVGDAAGNAKRGEALGFQQSASSLGRILGPVTGGALFGHIGVPAPYVVGAVLSVIAVLLLQGARSAVHGEPAHTSIN
jgi:MFS family permease